MSTIESYLAKILTEPYSELSERDKQQIATAIADCILVGNGFIERQLTCDDADSVYRSIKRFEPENVLFRVTDMKLAEVKVREIRSYVRSWMTETKSFKGLPDAVVQIGKALTDILRITES